MFLQASAQALTVIMKTNHINDIIYHFHTLDAWGQPQGSCLNWTRETQVNLLNFKCKIFHAQIIFSAFLKILWAISLIT